VTPGSTDRSPAQLSSASHQCPGYRGQVPQDASITAHAWNTHCFALLMGLLKENGFTRGTGLGVMVKTNNEYAMDRKDCERRTI